MPLNIRKGPQARSLRATIYGPEGIGKSTLASKFPDAVFIDFEHGTDTMDVARFDTPDDFDGLIQLLKSIAQEDVCKSVVLDTADKMEAMLAEKVCDEKNFKSIEDAGYGKGYSYLADKWLEVLRACDDIVESGKNIVFVAHAQMRKFEQPDEMGAYDRWELKLSKKTAPLLKEWSDMLLFCNYKSNIVEDPKTKSKKAIGGKRIMYATHSPVYDAKNRFGLPDSMDMEFDEISHIFLDPAEIKRKKVEQIMNRLNEADITEEDFIHWISVQDPTNTATTVAELTQKYIDFLIPRIDKILIKIKTQEA